MNASDSQTDGHEEIEIALLRLAQVTGNKQYQEMAKRFIARRGKVTGYGWKMAVQLTRTGLRMSKVDTTRKEYYSSHPDQERIKLPGRNAYHQPRWIGLRLVGSLLSGRFTQNEKPVVEQDRTGRPCGAVCVLANRHGPCWPGWGAIPTAWNNK